MLRTDARFRSTGPIRAAQTVLDTICRDFAVRIDLSANGRFGRRNVRDRHFADRRRLTSSLHRDFVAHGRFIGSIGRYQTERIRLIRFKVLRFSRNLILLAFNHFDTGVGSALLERWFFRRSFDDTTSTVRVVVELISQRATRTTGTQLAFQRHHRGALNHSRLQHRRFRSHRQRGHGAPRKPTHQYTADRDDRQDRLTSTYRHNPSSKNDPHETRGTAGTTKPPWAPNPQRQKNMKRRNSDARNQTGPSGRMERQSGLKLAESQPGQRERERERRVSDADASYNGRSNGTRTLKHVIPQ